MRVLPPLIGLCLLSACANPAVSPTATETPVATPSYVSDAPVHLVVGQPKDLSQVKSLPRAVVTVESVTEKATCPTGAATPKNGQFVAVQLSAQRLDDSAGFQMAAYDWVTLDGDGKEVPATAGVVTGLCLTDGSGLKLAYDASGRTGGTLLLDAPATVTAIQARNQTVNPPVVVTVDMPAR